MLIPKIEDIKKADYRIFKTNYPDFYKYLIETYPSDISFSEKLYWYYHDIKDYPICPICGNRVNFKKLSKGYFQFCSLKCSNNSPEVQKRKTKTAIEKYGSVENAYKKRQEKTKETIIEKYGSVENAYKKRQEKTKETNLERYGVEYTFQVEKFKNKTRKTLIEKYGSVENAYINKTNKSVETNLERYGVEHIFQLDKFKNKSVETNLERYGVKNPMQCLSIQKKVRETNLERYGVEHIFQVEEFKNKTRKTLIEKYGVEYAQQSEFIKNKSRKTISDKFLNNHKDIICIFYKNDEKYYKCKCPHNNCEKCIEKYYMCTPSVYGNRRYKKMEVCTKLLPEQYRPQKKTSLELFVHNILNEYDINFETNNRTILSPKELDIYIPNKNLAIECNGLKWHSDEIKSSNFHINKYIDCKNQNVNLLNFWEHDIVLKPTILKSILLDKLGIYTYKISAHKCYIRLIKPKIVKEFLNENCLYDYKNGYINLGLFNDNVLMAVMCIKQSKDISNYEITNFCCKNFTKIYGGFSKLLKYFVKMYDPCVITARHKNDMGISKLFYDNNFIMKDYNNLSSFRYIDKKQLIAVNNIDKCKTNDYFKIYDSGETIYELILNK